MLTHSVALLVQLESSELTTNVFSPNAPTRPVPSTFQTRQLLLGTEQLAESVFIRDSFLPTRSPTTHNHPQASEELVHATLQNAKEARRLVSAALHRCDEVGGHATEQLLAKILLSLLQGFGSPSERAQLHLNKTLIDDFPKLLGEIRPHLQALEERLSLDCKKLKNEKTTVPEATVLEMNSEFALLISGGETLLSFSRKTSQLSGLLDADEKSLGRFKEASIVAFKLAPNTIVKMTCALIHYHQSVYGGDEAGRREMAVKFITLIGSWDKSYGQAVSKTLLEMRE